MLGGGPYSDAMPNINRQGLPRFSLKDLLLSATLIAGGLSLLVVFFHAWPFVFDDLGEAAFWCWYGGGVLIMAGLFAPFRRPLIGAAVGLGIQLLLAFVSKVMWL